MQRVNAFNQEASSLHDKDGMDTPLLERLLYRTQHTGSATPNGMKLVKANMPSIEELET